MSDLALFAYGSLVRPESAGTTLGREVEIAALARLAGWRRAWSLARDNHTAEKAFARVTDGSLPDWCLGLNLEPEPAGPEPNGVLIAVSEAELRRLDLREIRYDRIEVTASVRPDQAAAFERVYTYRAKPRHHHRTPPPGAIVIAEYLRTVESGFAALGEAELAAFHATTGPPPVEVVEATLVRDHIPPGNPRGW